MIYIDLGCYTGDSVEQFINWGQLLRDIHDAEIYGFDPNPNFAAKWQDIHDRHIKHVKSINFSTDAAWVEDSEMSFSVGDLGSTLMVDKNTFIPSTVIDARCFDFSSWLKRFAGDEVYVKFDIEGAEYPVLEKMIQDGTDKLAKLLFIEWHADKMNEEYKAKEEWIKKNLHCKWLEWR